MDYSGLEKYIPKGGIFFIEKWLSPYWFNLKIKNPRETKLGDYRRPLKGQPHQITVNAGMNKSLCFFILTHEIAHLLAFEENKNKKILPHGTEWKKTFSKLILESIDEYEEELQKLLIEFTKNPKAAFHSDSVLAEYFIKKENPNKTLLSDLEEKSYFKLRNKIYIKETKRKTRYICTELYSKRAFLISGTASVEMINK